MYDKKAFPAVIWEQHKIKNLKMCVKKKKPIANEKLSGKQILQHWNFSSGTYANQDRTYGFTLTICQL